MKLYLVRHGEAKSVDDDQHRSLTDRGREGIESVAKAAKGFGVMPLKIIHSGKLRAEQTAEIIADILGCSERPGAIRGLNPNDDVHAWAEEVAMETDDLMLVGHLPFMDRLASLLVRGGEALNFNCGTMVCLGYTEDKGWVVQWIRKP